MSSSIQSKVIVFMLVVFIGLIVFPVIGGMVDGLTAAVDVKTQSVLSGIRSSVIR